MLVRTTTRTSGIGRGAFGTADRGEVERYCRPTRPNSSGSRRHPAHLAAPQRRGAPPVTGQRCWFNQIAFLNERTIDPEVPSNLVDLYGEDGLPVHHQVRSGDPVARTSSR